jgi:Spy/CpxP family protein refolding chaperone
MKTPILAITFIALGFASTATAQRGDGPGRQEFRKDIEVRIDDRSNFRGPGQGFERMVQVLDLTDEQKTKIEALQVPHMKKMQAYRNQLGEKKAQERTLVTSEKPDSKKINALIEEIGKIQTDMKKAQVAHRLEIRALLTDIQQIKFDSMGQRMGNRTKRDGCAYQPNWK